MKEELVSSLFRLTEPSKSCTVCSVHVIYETTKKGRARIEPRKNRAEKVERKKKRAALGGQGGEDAVRLPPSRGARIYCYGPYIVMAYVVMAHIYL